MGKTKTDKESFAKGFIGMIETMLDGEPLVIDSATDMAGSLQWIIAAQILSANLQNEHYKDIMSRLDKIEARLDKLDKQ